MKKRLNWLFLPALALILGISSCNTEEEVKNIITLSRSELSFPSEGGSLSLLLQTDASEWRIQNPTDWITLSQTSGTEENASITLNVTTKTAEERKDTLKVLAGDADPVKVFVSQTASEILYDLTSSHSALDFQRKGSNSSFTITTDAPEWNVSSTAEWLSFDPATGSAGTTTVTVTADTNEGEAERTGIITVTGAYAPTAEISATQNGELYPSYNTDPIAPDMTGMESTATQLAAKMSLGWNIGNTLEAIGGETAWGNPKVNGALLDLVKANGFDAIRIPCAWDQYLENPTTAKIKDSWLERVDEVVNLCIERDLYVILNIHWDGGWLEKNISTEKQESVNAKQKALWEQIATKLRDYDEHLILASANEPDAENATQMAVLTSYHQTFIDAVRSTGGKNSYRVLVVQGPLTDIQKTDELMNTLPTDEIANRMMAEVHYYTPYNFCLMEADADWGKMFYYWGAPNHSTTDTERNPTYGEEDDMSDLFASMNVKFVRKGIPVILGEFGAMRRTDLTGETLEKHLASRAYFYENVVKKCKENGMIPFYWDNGAIFPNTMSLFDRTNNTVYDQQAINGLLKGLE